jgi:hypothetical protein
MKTTAWRKSSRSSGDQNSNCVELRRTSEGGYEVRDSKLGVSSPIFGLGRQDLESLLGAAR